MQIIAKTMQGLESVLAEEIRVLGGTNIETLTRAVSYEGEMDLVYKSNYLLRTALKILVPVDEFQVMDEKALYDRVNDLPWEDLFGLKQTFAIDAVTTGGFFRHSKYAALKTKDAIVDRFQRLFGKRPNVNVVNPDFKINLHIRKRTVTLSLDSSGESLHKRGYRINSVEAPLNEVLAAGLVLLSDWDKKSTLLDPMCGSGTIVIEAAKIALKIPPQSPDRDFLFKKWENFDASLWDNILASNSTEIHPLPFKIVARDKSLRNLKASQFNIEEAGLASVIETEKVNFFRYENDLGPLTLITNPPYDERLKEDDIKSFYEMIGSTLKQDYTECSAWIISGHPEAFKSIGLRPSKKISLYNGPILSKYHHYQMYAGSKKASKQ
jgi:putative N6-adenine-specific DNA methylase